MTATRTTAAQAAAQMRVLIVDDNRDAADSLATLVRLWGFDARTAYDGVAGLEAAAEYRPDCLMLDIGMPRMDGYTLAQRLRQQPDLSRARMVALSAYSGEEHQRRVRESGFDHWLVKPAHPDVLQRLLHMIQQAIKLAERTEALARQNVELARETKAMLSEVKAEIKDVKQELREVREELRETRTGHDAGSDREDPDRSDQ
ncbi:MAG: response regulator [Gemmataceae bacterium]